MTMRPMKPMPGQQQQVQVDLSKLKVSLVRNVVIIILFRHTF